MSLTYFQQFFSTFEFVKLYIMGKVRSVDTTPQIVQAKIIPCFNDYTVVLRDKHRAKKEILPLDVIKSSIPDNVKNCGELTLFIEYTHNHHSFVYPLRFPDDSDLPFPPGSYEMTFNYNGTSEIRIPLTATLKGKDDTKELDVYDVVMKFIGPNNDFFVSNGLMLNACLVAEWVGWRNDGKWTLEIMDDSGETNIFDPTDIICLPKNKYNR